MRPLARMAWRMPSKKKAKQSSNLLVQLGECNDMGDWNLPWREYNNGTLFFIQMFMWFAVMFFICRRSKEVRWAWNDAPLKLGIALAVYFFGAFLSRGSTWV